MFKALLITVLLNPRQNLRELELKTWVALEGYCDVSYRSRDPFLDISYDRREWDRIGSENEESNMLQLK